MWSWIIAKESVKGSTIQEAKEVGFVERLRKAGWKVA
jgi:hypothetical protein